MNIAQRLFLILSLVIIPMVSLSQDAFAPLNRDYYHMVDRLDVMDSGNTAFYTSHKPYRRMKLGNYVQPKLYQHENLWNSLADSSGGIVSDSVPMDLADMYDLQFLGKDNWEYSRIGWRGKSWRKNKRFDRLPGILNTNASVYSVDEDNFTLSINPVLGLSKSFDSDDDANLFQNTRGVQARGAVGGKVGFYAFVSENQVVYPHFYRNQIDSTGVIPGVGFHKAFKEDGRDFFQARGYVTFSPIDEIAVQFGHDQNFIGDGYRSLIWSDNAKENLFLKLQTEVWKVRYMNIFSELADVDQFSGTGEGVNRKYSAFHHLTVAFKPNLHIGFFEHVIFDRSDSNGSQGYEINYLNPMIFYRAAEHGLNSSDNVIVGMNWKWNFKRRFSFYGQYVLDEFKKDELLKRTGWWANKWAFQSGIKYINAFNQPWLDLQYEFNTVRPYTYMHYKTSQNYTNYKQSMAHPLGANFAEHGFIARAHLGRPIYVVAKVFYSKQGLDSSSNTMFTNGADLSKTYQSRPKDTGIRIGEGVSNELLSTEIRMSYLFVHNLFVDAIYSYRTQKNEILGEQNSAFFTLGLRYNLPYKSYN